MSNSAVCPNCGAKAADGDITYGLIDNKYEHLKKYARGYEGSDGRKAYGATCDKCGTCFVEFWKFDETVKAVDMQYDKPSWISEGNWVWNTRSKVFGKINSLVADAIGITDINGVKSLYTLESVIADFVEARVRPYTRSEMFALTGMVVKSTNSYYQAVVIYVYKGADNIVLCRVAGSSTERDAEGMLKYYEFPNGSPCGVLERRTPNVITGEWTSRV